jgi:hypothetical protein
MTQLIAQGTVHPLPDDLRQILTADGDLLDRWQGLTALGRNEFICWVEDARQPATRERRLRRTAEELREGKKRPCCWHGCIHRTDKAPSKWLQDVLIDRKGR